MKRSFTRIFSAPRRSSLRPFHATLVALAVGLLLVAPANAANLVTNGSFGIGSADVGPPPTTFDAWRGDNVSYVTAQNGITAPDGAKMLRFINTSPNGPDADGNSSQYYQNIDLSAYHSDILTGNVTIDASALFNRVLGDSQTDTEFNIEIYARSGTPTSFVDLAFTYGTVFSDGDPSTWELGSIHAFSLPTTTTFLMVEVAAHENIHNDSTNPEFDGHYADKVIVTLAVPEPSTGLLALLACGLILPLRKRFMFLASRN